MTLTTNKTIDITISETNKQSVELYKERAIYNNKILRILKRYLRDNPQMRFIQALWVLGIEDATDRFSEESRITYNRMKQVEERSKKLKENLQQERDIS